MTAIFSPPASAPSASSPGDSIYTPADTFVRRHLGADDAEIAAMLKVVGYDSLDALTDATVPAGIRSMKPLSVGPLRGEHELLAEFKTLAGKNQVFRSFIGQGYYDTITPPVILRNIFENPGWYTQYTPYQAEISQGRLEALLNFQTMVSDLTALPLASASLLDEGTAAAEAMTMCVGIHENARKVFYVDHRCHPQTIDVVRTRAWSLGIDCRIVKISDEHVEVGADVAGVLVQYPTTDGAILDYAEMTANIHKTGGLVVVATDLLALTLITPPGEFGADIAVGSAQRFGVPLGFGGPHAGFMSTKSEYARKMPGRLVGVSKDAQGNPAMRLTLQTREQHIRRERATSNICTAQVLLAIIASMYAVYHGPEGLKKIARRTHTFATLIAFGAKTLGHVVKHEAFFDTLQIELHNLAASDLQRKAAKEKINFRIYEGNVIGISTDELTSVEDVHTILELLESDDCDGCVTRDCDETVPIENRKSPFLDHPVFNTHHTEHEMLRYIKRLESRDLSLAHSMIPLGSCTMKLNATTEMIPVTWPEIGRIHPFAPADQWQGYAQMFQQLEAWLADITGFAATWLQPNAGSQGEYAGLLMIRAYHESRGDLKRDLCLIPTSAHGTNPASAVIAGFKVVPVNCDAAGNIDLADLKTKAEKHKENLAGLMITYPSTHGVFEEGVREACDIVHAAGGQVYMDGANMNAQVGLTSPGAIGADVCHLNLHKTFCIPHGGGGPGMGPICMAAHLAPFIPICDLRFAICDSGKGDANNAIANRKSKIENLRVSSAYYGSASILPISYIYIALMGSDGLRKATQVAILNANYMAKKLEAHYPILYRGKSGTCAHEFILDCRGFEKSAGVKVEDIAKRLIDFGFHAPTMSWPVPGTLMIEPTESESPAELDRFVEALTIIRREIADIEAKKVDAKDNPLKNAPHTAAVVTADEWSHAYSRQQAAYPAPWLKEWKFWPGVGRVDNVFGDRNLVCTCPPMSDYAGI
ncbi:MAG TPA: aminomethyl-transferring glycine dehydrogenase [Tepidisphaeraceae bacterium]|jgi:glycine dehydrogenase